MKTEKEWHDREIELANLIKERDAISYKIVKLRSVIRQHKMATENPPDKTSTIAFQMFGKCLKDLSEEEFKEYNRERQRINRQKRKERAQST